MYEHANEPLASRAIFFWRVLRHLGVALLFFLLSLGVGMIGYHYLEQMDWVDSFANAATLLVLAGPLTTIQTDGGKIFTGFYAMYSGLAFLTINAILFAPFLHRFLHRFHLQSNPDEQTPNI